MSTIVVEAHPKCLRMQERYYERRGWVHAYRHYETAIEALLTADKSVLDVGCGRTFPLARKLLASTAKVFGADPLAEPDCVPSGATVSRNAGESLGFESERFDVVVCRSVLEHVCRPEEFFSEVGRVLRPGGSFVFLTPNKLDYISVAAMMIPNRFHPWLVRRTEGRAEADTFATYYRANTHRRIRKLSCGAGLQPVRLEYLNHCPSYFMFSPLLYRLGAAYDRLICGPRALSCLRGWILGVATKPATA